MKLGVLMSVVLVIAATGLTEAQQKPKKPTEKQLKSNLKKVESKKNAVRQQLRATKRQASYVLADIQKADDELGNLEDRIDYIENRLKTLASEKIRLEKDLQIAEQVLVEQTEVIRQRMKRLYMQPQGTAIGSILASDSLGDMAARRAIFERIAEEDQETFDEYKKRVTEVEQKKKLKESVIVETNELMADVKLKKVQVGQHKAKKKVLLGELRSEQADLQQEFDELDRESNAIESQINAFQSVNTGLPRFNGRFRKPVNGRITSGYGYRFHPVLHRSKLHTGIDFGAPTGTPIYASAPGVVISAGYRGGYGNTVIIDHGGGIATLYGHCSRIFTKAGAKVSQGEKIAAVGSTGMSTGPHLHFEIRVNGKPVNPMGRI